MHQSFVRDLPDAVTNGEPSPQARLEFERLHSPLDLELGARTLAAKVTPAREGGLRAQVSTWGGTDVLKALGQWHEAYDDVVEPLVGSGDTITLPIQAADRMRTATAAVVTAVRAGIDPEDKTTVQEVADALFTQPDRPRGKL